MIFNTQSTAMVIKSKRNAIHHIVRYDTNHFRFEFLFDFFNNNSNKQYTKLNEKPRHWLKERESHTLAKRENPPLTLSERERESPSLTLAESERTPHTD